MRMSSRVGMGLVSLQSNAATWNWTARMGATKLAACRVRELQARVGIPVRMEPQPEERPCHPPWPGESRAGGVLPLISEIPFSITYLPIITGVLGHKNWTFFF